VNITLTGSFRADRPPASEELQFGRAMACTSSAAMRARICPPGVGIVRLVIPCRFRRRKRRSARQTWVVHLARRTGGPALGRRVSKRRIRESRVMGTRNLVEAAGATLRNKPRGAGGARRQSAITARAATNCCARRPAPGARIPARGFALRGNRKAQGPPKRLGVRVVRGAYRHRTRWWTRRLR